MGDWHEVDHTADLALRVWGDDLGDLFVSAALGMYSLLADPVAMGDPVQFEVALAAPDAEVLLVDWLTELLYLHESESFVGTVVSVESVSETGLRATISGFAIGVRLAHIKAATYHLLKVTATEGGYETQIVFDV